MTKKDKVFSSIANQTKYPFILPDLPYNKGSLVPHISMETLEYHHGKHHQAYVNNLNDLIKENEFKDMDLEQIIIKSKADNATSIFNNAAQIWNHTFYWNSMKNPQTKPSNKMLAIIESDLGGMEKFIELFKKASNHFASSWVWLVVDKNKKLKITSTGNADTPVTEGEIPILVCDTWEHAYYIDFRNKRADYVSVFLQNLINWDFAEENYTKAING